MSRVAWTVLLLVCSNLFMTAAWYGHLKFGAGGEAGAANLTVVKLLPIIFISWLIALPEYALQVPANRLGHVNFGGPLSAPQLKILQEAITLLVFTGFATLYLREKLRI
ncbi:MAG: DMT family protein, partial [Planctomycetota bacterium]|nr:DMT family protein [Planctomycetota bacterium]